MIEVSEQTFERMHMILAGIEDVDKKVLKPAMARVLMAGKTEAKRQAVQVYRIQPSDFQKSSYIKYKGIKSHKDGEMIGEIEFAGSPIPLYKYEVTPAIPKKNETPAAAVLKTNSLVAFNKKGDVHVLQMKSGHVGIYKAENGKIKELYAPSTPKMVENEEVKEKIEERVAEVLNKRIEHEMQRLLSGV